ncbi:hypothetical protein ACA910_009815 [Epithemia clementina (nom. ined.)]
MLFLNNGSSTTSQTPLIVVPPTASSLLHQPVPSSAAAAAAASPQQFPIIHSPQPVALDPLVSVHEPALYNKKRSYSSGGHKYDDEQQPSCRRKRRRSPMVRFDNKVIERQSSCALLMEDENVHPQPPCDNGTKPLNSCSSTTPTLESVYASTLWYSRQEYAQFKALVLADTKSVIEKCRKTKRPQVSSMIARAFHAISTATDVLGVDHHKNHAPCTGNNHTTNTATTTSCARVTAHSDDLSAVVSFFHNCADVIGLERVLDLNIYRNRKRRRSSQLKAIQDVQSPAFLRHACGNDPHLRATILSKACSSISTSSVLFAQYLGLASAAASSTSIIAAS